MPLLTRKTLPPGGWRFEQYSTDGRLLRRFKGSGPFSDFCRDVLACRVGNQLPRATIEEVMMDVDKFQCDRLGNDPRHCRSGSGPVALNVQAAQVQPKRSGCASCGGRKA